MSSAQPASRWVAMLMVCFGLACRVEPAPESGVADSLAASSAPVPAVAEGGEAAGVGLEEPTDTLALRIGLVDPGCALGVCVCRGSTERSTGLWRVNLETPELAVGVHCVAVGTTRSFFGMALGS